ncbi:MAG: sigma-70 family RNA polymerase sigma factor [Oscillospiraceae bacterium]|nr:sigma-70 family RNA polymerase sigma factor [Oscillospiraceae bacterium]
MIVTLAAMTSEIESAFMTDIYIKYSDIMRRKAEKLLSSETEAEELVQDVFAKLIERAETVMAVEEKKLPAYLMAAVKFTVMNHYRRRNVEKKYFTEVDEEEAVEFVRDEAPLPEELYLQKERAKELSAALHKIPEKDRIILENKYILEMSDSEIAVQFGISESSVRCYLTRARRKACAIMMKEGEYVGR